MDTSSQGKNAVIRLEGKEGGFPFISSKVYFTAQGVSYLQVPGVALIARPQTELQGIYSFLEGFSNNLGFEKYGEDPDMLQPGSALCKFAGQLCYASFGPRRTWNKDAARYFKNIMESGHGSVLEHASLSFLFYGISRSLTHELVRHRHFSFSQISQRYVSGKVLRFVERPEYQEDEELHEAFENRIEIAAAEYERTASRLLDMQQQGSALLSGEMKTDLRKKVQQTARSLLPNETEAPIVVTGNVRAWRHFLEMRSGEHAEIEIRALAYRVYLCLYAVEPMLFEDYQVITLPDGTYELKTETAKV